MRGLSLPVLAYSGEKAWGHSQRQADTNSVTASLGSHSSGGGWRVSLPTGWTCFSPQVSVVALESHPLAGAQASMASRNSPLRLGSPLSSGREVRGGTLSRTEKAQLFLELPRLSKPFTEGSNGLDKPSEVPGCYSVPFVRLMNLLSHRINTISCAKEVIFYTAVP